MGVYHVSKLTFRSCSLCGGNLLQARLVLLLGGSSGGGDGGLQGVPRHAPRRQSQGPKTSLYGAPHVEPTSYICTRGPEGSSKQAYSDYSKWFDTIWSFTFFEGFVIIQGKVMTKIKSSLLLIFMMFWIRIVRISMIYRPFSTSNKLRSALDRGTW